ncbi:hypothetical protein SFRURICE_015769 [Spodoptera frugiperda]|uniref:SFRICE_039552 n=1 Tax=Spodoptera frugiperda TaxID=7108 RepID=A0A2H1VZR7_SPOFR|nr:hypothetical protein SFRURICE_015769 [Spodoptera frugiperda]
MLLIMLHHAAHEYEPAAAIAYHQVANEQTSHLVVIVYNLRNSKDYNKHQKQNLKLNNFWLHWQSATSNSRTSQCLQCIV